MEFLTFDRPEGKAEGQDVSVVFFDGQTKMLTGVLITNKGELICLDIPTKRLKKDGNHLTAKFKKHGLMFKIHEDVLNSFATIDVSHGITPIT